MQVKHWSIVFTLLLVVLPAAHTQAQNTLYEHNFGGGGGALDGVLPDFNGGLGVWNAGAMFLDDGTVNDSNGSASLPFVPAENELYTIEASVLNAEAGSGWIGFGFMDQISDNPDGGNARHSNTEGGGYAWVLTRNDTGDSDQQAFGGRRTSNPFAGISGDLVDPTQQVDFKIVLDTSGGVGSWTAEYFMNDSSFGSQTLPAGASDINRVGFSKAAGADPGQLISFRMLTSEVVFDPADVNNSGGVDEFDYFTIRDNLFETEVLGNPVTKVDGDIVPDGIVDFADFRLWKDSAPANALIAAGFAVPEPTTATLVAFGLAMACCTSVRNRRG